MNKIKAVIFDLDGTIANTLPLCIKAFRHAIEPYLNRPISDEEIIATFGPSEEGTITTLIPNYYNQGVADYQRHYEAFHDMCPKPFEGVKELLDTLQANHIRLAMVTGKGRKSAIYSLKKFGLEQYFEVIETGSPKGSVKSEGIQNILDKFDNLSKEEVIYVGDAPSDIGSSRTVGVPVISAAWAATAEPEKLISLQPDQLFYTFSNFEKWLIAMI